jgi:hypothetical protein
MVASFTMRVGRNLHFGLGGESPRLVTGSTSPTLISLRGRTGTVRMNCRQVLDTNGRGPSDFITFLSRSPLPPALPLLAEPRSQTLSHDSKSPCSAGKATHRAAAERSSSGPEDESLVSGILRTSQAALVADLLCPGWSRIRYVVWPPPWAQKRGPCGGRARLFPKSI